MRQRPSGAQAIRMISCQTDNETAYWEGFRADQKLSVFCFCLFVLLFVCLFVVLLTSLTSTQYQYIEQLMWYISRL